MQFRPFFKEWVRLIVKWEVLTKICVAMPRELMVAQLISQTLVNAQVALPNFPKNVSSAPAENFPSPPPPPLQPPFL